MRRRKVKAMQVGKGKAAGFLEEEVGAWSVERGAWSVQRAAVQRDGCSIRDGMDGDKLARELAGTGLLRLQR